MKHSEYILAVDAVYDNMVSGLEQGLSQIGLGDFCEAVAGSLVIRQRRFLETCSDYRQILPYVLLTQQREDGSTVFIPYFRAKGVGEERLLGNVSVGFGGHIDLADVVFTNDSIINLNQTIMTNVSRELSEELTMSSGGVDLPVYDIGLIADDSNEVGKVHLGICLMMQLPAGVVVTANEPSLEIIEPMTAKELLDKYSDKLENWSRIVLEKFAGLGRVEAA